MKKGVFTLLALLALCLSVGAQSEQQISGSVLDASGAAVPNATVKVTNDGTGATRTVTANNEGNYVVTNIPYGTYTVTASAPGFKTYVSQGVVLNVGSKVSVNVRLDIGAVSETIEVQAESLQVETTTGEVGHLVSSTEALNLQLNGRNFISLVSLLPGTSSVYTSAFRGLYGPFGNVGAGQAVNGARADMNTLLVNNVDNKDQGGPSTPNYVNVSPDFIAEVKTIAASQSAQYGLNAGATISTALKTGTRGFHGSLFEYFRNDAIQARSFNSPAKKPPLRYNNYGWSFGGPVFIPGFFNQRKEKAFFFVGQDYKRRRLTEITPLNVPTLAQRSGGSSAIGQALINLYPLPGPAGSCTGGNLCIPNPFPVDVTENIIKGDYIINEKNTLTGHFIHDDNYLGQGTTNALLFDRLVQGVNTGVQWTSVINPTTVNTVTVAFGGGWIDGKQGIVPDLGPNILHLGGGRVGGVRPNPNMGFPNEASLLRVNRGLTYSTIFNVSPVVPTVQISGLSTLSVSPLNFTNYTHTYQAKDDFSKVVGNHTVKAGIIVQRGRKNQDGIQPFNGMFQFNSVAQAQSGIYNTYTEADNITQSWSRYTNVEPYFQDDWKVNQRLTLNLGVRYAYIQPSFLALNNGSNFVPELYNPANAPTISPTTGLITSAPGTYNPYNGIVIPGEGFPSRGNHVIPESIRNSAAVQALFDAKTPQGFAKNDGNTFSPRVGFAYDLTGRQSTVVRGGFGILYERILTTVTHGTTSNPPFQAPLTLLGGNVSNPGGGTIPNAPRAFNRAMDPNLKNPRIFNWSFGVQQSLGSGTVLDVAYVASAARRLTYNKNINQLPEGTLAKVPLAPGVTNPNTMLNSLRPYKGYGDINLLTNGGVWNYNSLQAQFQRRFHGGGNVRAAYTWSKNLTDVGYDYAGTPMDSYNVGRDYGPSPYNKPHVLTVSYTYPLPFWQTGSDWYKKAFGGWSLTGITVYSSGWPINAYVANDVGGVGSNAVPRITLEGATGLGRVQRADLIGDPYANTNRLQWLNPAAFAVPAAVPGRSPFATRFGNAGPFAFKGPRISNWDITAAKDFRVTEQVVVKFRAEMFNAFNHLSYTYVNGLVGSPTFGQVTGATDPRTFEFALRVEF